MTTLPYSDDEFSDEDFELIDNEFSTVEKNKSFIPSLSHGVAVEDNVDDELDTTQEVDEAAPESDEVNDLHETIAVKDAEIDRLTALIEQLNGEIQDAKINVDIIEKTGVENIDKLKKTHRAELKKKDVELKAFKQSLFGLRTIKFRKVNGCFGAGHMGTSISSVVEGGPADLAGLMKGDHLISINGTKVDCLSEDSITKLSENVGDDVTLVVRFRPERLVNRMKSNY